MTAIQASDLQYLKGVGPKRAEAFASVGINTVRDLLFYFPLRHIDRTSLLSSQETADHVLQGFEGEVTIVGKVVDKMKRCTRRSEFATVTMQDARGHFELIWFRQGKFFYDRFNEGETYAVSGKPTLTKHHLLQFAHPDFDRITDEESQSFFNTGKIIPVYSSPKQLKASKIGDFSIRRIIHRAIDERLKEIEETLQGSLLEKHHLLPLMETVKQMHFPENQDKLGMARERLKFEELFFIELLVALRKNNYQYKQKGIGFRVQDEIVKSFASSLPFTLTDAQKKVLGEIKQDMRRERPMNRLLQGDVGSGKTVVALFAMLAAVDDGYQAALLAPTEILAAQHAANITTLLEEMYGDTLKRPVLTLLTGSQKKGQKDSALHGISSGQANIVIGTHAIFEQKIRFENLGLIVVDEQHRFGVKQRAKLVQKGLMPDVLVMSATPIPRTLSLTLYGDLDVSTIDAKPRNRKPVKTYLAGEGRLPEIYKGIVDKTKTGSQAFIIYPLVEESEKVELKAAEKYYAELSNTWFKGINVGLIHGKMKWDEKELAMKEFSERKYDVLISTTVIEVGIDIPNADYMIINDAHRFGLSQLHQLRGRVGRGERQSYCILVTTDEVAAASKRVKGSLEYLSPQQLERYKSSIRLQTMVDHTDGFKIAEVDLQLRGPGDIFGVKQSGLPQLQFADLTTDMDLLTAAKHDAFSIIEKDPSLKGPEHAAILSSLKKHYSESLKYASIA